jgi:hypothetical protein
MIVGGSSSNGAYGHRGDVIRLKEAVFAFDTIR